MILKHGDLILKYKKVNKKNGAKRDGVDATAPEKKSKIVSGKLILGHEVRSFRP